MYENDIIFLIEPYYIGLLFVDACKKIGCEYIIVRREDGPFLDTSFGESIISNIFDIDETSKKIKERIKKKTYSNIAILPGTDFCTDITAKLAVNLGLTSNTVESAVASRNKLIMRNILKEQGVKCPQYRFFNSAEEIKNEIDSFNFPVVIKPTDMAGSCFVTLVDTPSELITLAETICSLSNNVLNYKKETGILVEEYIEGIEFSIELVLSKGEVYFTSVTEKCKGDLPLFIEFGHIVPPRNLDNDTIHTLVDTAIKTSNAIGLLHGPAHVELILSDKGPQVVEIASRMGGDNIMKLTEVATGVSIPKLVIDLSLNKQIQPIYNVSYIAASAIKYIECTPGTVVKIKKNIDPTQINNNILDIHLDIKEGDIVPKLESSYDRVGYVITKATNSTDAYKLADTIARNVKIDVQ